MNTDRPVFIKEEIIQHFYERLLQSYRNYFYDTVIGNTVATYLLPKMIYRELIVCPIDFLDFKQKYSPTKIFYTWLLRK